MALLQELIIIFTIAVAVVFICNRLGIPSIIGFLITGVFAGTGLLEITSSPDDVRILSEVGIILLLFTIGLEFSIKNLMQIGRTVLIGGTIQVLVTIGVIAGLLFCWKGFSQSLFYGFLIALSSTAIVMKIYQEKMELDTPHGRAVLAILIFQDIIVVPMMLLTPVLAGTESGSDGTVLLFVVKSAGLILFVFAMLKWIAPWLFYQFARTRSRELFILGAVVTCFAVAGLTYYIGLSLELGAFLAGLIISETEYSYETMGNIIPFRDVFASLFFISIGMLLDVPFMAANWLPVLGGGLAIIVIKFIIGILAVLLLGFSLKTSILVGFALSQIGEFSFVLSKVGYDNSLLDSGEYQTILAMSIVTMVFSSFILNYSGTLISLVMKLRPLAWMEKKTYRLSRLPIKPEDEKISDHLIVVGYGINGRNVSRAARVAGISYIIIETNPETVRRELAKGEKIIYGDASNEEVLGHANIAAARAIVTTVPDAPSSRRVVFMARKLNPGVYIIARTRFVKEVNDLYDLGASEVIPEEFETSVEIFTRLLRRFSVPENDIRDLVHTARSDGYQMFRTASIESIVPPDQRSFIKGMDVVSYRVEKSSPAEGRSIIELAIRKRFGVTILAVYNDGGVVLQNPDSGVVLNAGDIVMLVGVPEKVLNVCEMFKKC